MTKFVSALLLVVAITGCTTKPDYNARLEKYAPDYGYRFKNIDKKENSDDLFVILTFSGGGTRASALSLGVLEKLADTRIEWHGRNVRLLDEVDLISSVSGGSFTAAYYGMFGDRVFIDLKQWMYQKNNSQLIRLALKLPNIVKQASPFYSRTDTAANNYSNNVFEGLTFGDLLAKQQRPFILLNATDMGVGRQFSFTQDNFDLLYSDLSKYPLGNAVAASSAYPGAFTALLLKNYEKGPDFVFDPWYEDKIKNGNLGTFQHQTASDIKEYLDEKKIFVHLSDGGVSDNLGLLPILGALLDPDRPMCLVPTTHGAEQKVVVIVVNAAGRAPDKLSYGGKLPGIIKLLSTAGSTPMGFFSEAQIAYLQLMFEYLQKTGSSKPGEVLEPGTNAARLARSEAPRRFYYTEVGFDKIINEEERKFFQTIPTSFTLAPESVDRLRKVGGTILDNDPVFQDLLGEIGAKDQSRPIQVPSN